MSGPRKGGRAKQALPSSSLRELRVLVVDDERPALEDLARILRASELVEQVQTAARGEEALGKLALESFDAVFLDVRMPGLSGVELARVMKRFATPPAVVFVTAHETAAVEAFELQAVDYVLKPASRQRVEEALRRVAAQRATPSPTAPEQATPPPPTEERPEPDLVPVDVRGGGTRLVRRDSILYLQARGDYVRIVSDDGRFLLRARLSELERRWERYGFVRVHRAFVVNLRRAVEVRPRLNGTAVVVFADGAEVPIARRQVPELRRLLSA
jgi:DNA-binding LytR/AlgR family response regulator